MNFIEEFAMVKLSVAGQIEHWAKIGKIAEENPDLTLENLKLIPSALLD